MNTKRPTETPGMVLNSVRIKASKYFSGMYSKAAASGRFIRRYFLHYLWIGILAVLDHIGRLAEDLAALPWEEMAEKVFFLPYRVLQQGKASGKNGFSGLRGWFNADGYRKIYFLTLASGFTAGFALVFTAYLLNGQAVTVSEKHERQHNRMVAFEEEFSESTAGTSEIMQTEEQVPESGTAVAEKEDNSPLYLMADGPVHETRAYPLAQPPGLVVDVRSRGSAQGFGKLDTSHPYVKHMKAKPYKGGTRFVIYTNGTEAPEWRLHTDGTVISVEFLDT